VACSRRVSKERLGALCRGGECFRAVVSPNYPLSLFLPGALGLRFELPEAGFVGVLLLLIIRYL